VERADRRRRVHGLPHREAGLAARAEPDQGGL